MPPEENSLEQVENGAYDSSLERVSTVSEPYQPNRRERRPAAGFNKGAFLVAAVSLVLILLIGAGGLWLLNRNAKQAGEGVNKSEYAVGKLSLDNLSNRITIEQAEHLTVNGRLEVSQSVVLAPGGAPTKPTPGQIYYDQTTNAPYYFNGTVFVSLAPVAIPAFPQHVASLGGTSGTISVGSGLQMAGGVLSNSGVVGLTAGSNVTVIDNGGGRFTISAAGTSGGVTGTGSAGQIALWTGGSTLAGSVLSQSGTTLTAGGNLTVTGNAAVSGSVTGGTYNGQTISAAANLTGTLTVAGAAAFNGNLTVQTGDTFTVSGDGFTDLTGNGLQSSGGALTLALQANKGLEVDANGLSLIDCVTGEILKYNGANQWGCSADAGAGGSGDSVQVNGTAVNSDVNVLDTAASGTIAATTWTLNPGSPDQLTLTIGAASATDAGILTTGAQTLAGAKTFNALAVFNGDLTVQTGDTFTLNGDGFTDLTGTGLVIGAGSLQTTLGVSVDLTSEVTGVLPIANGGTNANTPQAAINNLAGLTTNGDLLYHNGVNSTRLARGANGECLMSNATTIVWTSCAGTGTTFFTLAATSGTSQAINGGDTVTIAAGNSITTTAGATDTVTVDTIQDIRTSASPTFNGLTLAGLNTAGVVHTNGSGVLSTSAVLLGTETSGNYLASLGSVTGLTLGGTNGVAGGVPTLAVNYGSAANTAVQGNTSLTCASGTGNLTGGGNSITLGSGGSCNNITVVNSPTFSGTLSVQGAGGITVGVAGTTAGVVNLANGTNTNLGTIQTAVLGQGTTYTLPDPGSASTTICLSSGNCVGGGGGAPNAAAYLTVGNDGTLSSERAITAGTNLSASDGGANSTFTLNVVSNPTFSGLVTANGDLTIQTGDTFTFNGDPFTDLTGTGLIISGGALQAALGTSISNGEIDADAVTLGVQTTGNYVATISNGNGISGSSAAEGGTPTIALGNLTADWNQTGAFDILLNNAGSELRVLESAGATFYGTLDVGDLTADRTYTFPDSTGTVCLSTGNCAGSGTGVTSAVGGTVNRLAKFTAAQNIENSAISEDGTNVTVLGAVDLIVQGGDATLGIASTQTGSLLFKHAGSANTGTITQAALTGNQTYTLPNATGDFCLSSGNCLGGGGGAPNNAAYLTVGNDATLSAERAITAGTNLTSSDGGANSTFTLSVVNNPTFSGLLTANGDLTLQTGDTFTMNGDAFTDLTGTGLTIGGGALQATLGTSISNDEIDADAVTLGTQTTGNYVATITAGSGISGSSATEGGTPTIALGPLTVDWDQTGGFDIVLNNAGSELRVLESTGGTFYGTLDVGDLASDQTYSFIQGGTVVTSGNVASHATTGVTAGNGLTGGGTTGVLTVDIGAGNGITVNANDVTLALQASKGLEVDANGLSLIDCATDGYILKYSTGTSQWACAPDAGGAGLGDDVLVNGVNADGANFIDVTGNGTVTGTAWTRTAVNPDTITVAINNASATLAGAVTTAAQTFAGAKTFNGQIIAGAGIDLAAQTLQGTTAVIDFTNFDVLGNGNTTVGGTLTVTGLTTLNGDLTVQTGDTFTFNGDPFTDLTGTGLQISSGALQATLGTDINLASAEVTGILGLANGGTNANTAQGAINNISGLTTNGDLLYHNGTDSTRLARGSSGQCLTSTAGSIAWGSCAGAGSGVTLQAAYDNGNAILTSNNRDIAFTLADTAIDSNFVLNVATSSSSAFKVQNNSTDVLNIGAAGQLALSVQGSTGGLLVGGDANLYRSAANILKTDDRLQVVEGFDLLSDAGTAVSGIQFGSAQDVNLFRSAADILETEDQLRVTRPLAGSGAFFSRVTGDATSRFSIDADGTLKWGDGTAARDINLYRSAANLLRTDDGFIVGTLTTGSTAACFNGSNQLATCTGAGANTLQGAYDGGNTLLTTNARDIDFTLADSVTTDANFTIDIATGSTSELQVEANGVDVLQIGSAGQLQLDVQGSGGGILIGGDANLYRSAADTLATDDSFRIFGPSLRITNASGQLSFDAANSVSTAIIIAKVNGDTNDRLVVRAGGELEFGSGNTATDTNLYRGGIDTLSTDDRFAVRRQANGDAWLQGSIVGQAQEQFRLNSSATGPILNFGDGTATVDTNLYRGDVDTLTTDDRFSIRRQANGNVWLQGSIVGQAQEQFRLNSSATGPILNFGDGTATVDTNLYRSAADMLRTDDGFIVGTLTTGSTAACFNGSNQLATCTGSGGSSPTTLQQAYDNSSSPATITTSSAAKNMIIKSGVGFDSSSVFQVQNAAGTKVLNVDTVNSITSLRGTNSDATLGAEKVTNGTFTGNATGWILGTGWAYNSNNVTKTAGTAADLEQNISAVNGETYRVVFTISGWSAGCLTPEVGGISGHVVCANNTSHTQLITATGTGNLKLKANSAFAGTIDNVSVQRLTSANAVLEVRNSDNSVALEVRTGGSGNENSFIGLYAGASNTSGFDNTAMGYSALASNTSGINNSAYGSYALQNATTSTDNSAFGNYSLRNNTTGGANTAIGGNALENNLTGDYNTAIGYYALQVNGFNVGGGSGNVGVGHHAGVTTNSSNANTSGSNNTFIGSNSGPGTTTQLQNATAIGTNAVVSQSDSLVLGCIGGTNGCTTSTRVGIGTASPSSVLHVVGPNQATATTNAVQVLNVVGGSGGTAGAGQTGGVGSVAAITGGAGGAATDATGTPGAGGAINFTSGAGGNGTSTSANGSGGNIVLQGGAAGTGGSGAAGSIGSIAMQVGGGNVGIGTATPSSKLEIAGGQLLLNGAATSNAKIEIQTGANVANNFLYFQNNNGVRAVLTGGGSLVLGTSATAGRLGLAGQGAGNGVEFNTNSGGGQVNLYSPSNGVLRTDTAFRVGSINAGGTNLLCYDGNNQLATCSAAPGVGSYIFNGTSLQTSANFNIQTTAVGSVTAQIRAIAAQTADLLQIQNSSGTPIARFDAGGVLIGNNGSGANVAGSALTIAGGQGTGSAVGGNILFQYSPAGGSGSSLNALQTACSISGTNGSLSCPGAGASSERFGAGSAAAGVQSVAIGNGSSTTDQDSVAIGWSAIVGYQSVAIGRGASANLSDSVAIGNDASVNTTAAGIAIGSSATSTGGGIAIGGGASSTNLSSIALGYQATTTADYQLVIGGTTARRITSVYIGNGVTNAAPVAFTMQGTGSSTAGTAGAAVTLKGGAGTTSGAGSTGGAITLQGGDAGGSNIAGAATNINGGRGTGSGVGGNIVFQYAPAGGSGSSLNALQTACSISGTNGSFSCPGAGANSERFGSGTTAAANSLSVGYNASAVTGDAVAVGYSAAATDRSVALGTSTVGSVQGVAVGNQATNGGNSEGVALGFQAANTSTRSVAIGSVASAGNNAIAIGRSASAAQFSTALGAAATASFTDSIALGYEAVTTATNQLVIGGSSGGRNISNVYIGNGVTNAAPTAVSIQGTGSSTNGTAGAAVTVQGGAATVGNTNGGNLLLNGGAKIGTGTVGHVILQGTNSGNVGIGTASPGAKLDVVSATGGTNSLVKATSSLGVRYDLLENGNATWYNQGTTFGGAWTFDAIASSASLIVKTTNAGSIADITVQTTTHSGGLRMATSGFMETRASNGFDFYSIGTAQYWGRLNGVGLYVGANASPVTATSLLQLGSDAGTAASGITFGSTGTANLYRSATDTLRTDDLLVVGSFATGSLPTGVNGGIVYDSTTNKMKIYENGAYKTLCNTTDLGCGSGGGVTLQGAYDASSTPASIITTSSTKNIVLQAGSGFESTGMFQIHDDTGTSNLFVADTVNNRIGIGGSPSFRLHVTETATATSGINIANVTALTAVPGSAPGATTYFIGSQSTAIGSSVNINANTQLIGANLQASYGGTGTLGTAYGTNAVAINTSSGTISVAAGVSALVMNNSTGTIADGAGLRVITPANGGGGTITANYGVDVQSLAAFSANGQTRIGLRLQEAPDPGAFTGTTAAAIQLAGTSGTARSGILFGTDTNLYRVAADTLKTDDSFAIQRANGADTSLQVSVSADTQSRLQISANGTIFWGAGNAAVDTNLFRAAADTLRTEDAFQVYDGPTTKIAEISSAVGLQVSTTGASGWTNLGTDTNTINILDMFNDANTRVASFDGYGNLLAGGAATGTTGTTEATARTNVTNITLTTDAFSVNDVIFFNNAGQDYYTRVTVDNANGTYTVSPAVSYDASITVTKYTVQNIGATPTDYSTQSNRFFQGYFLGGIVAGAGSTHYADGSITLQGDTNLYRSAANTLRTDDNFDVGASLGAVGSIVANYTDTNRVVIGDIGTGFAGIAFSDLEDVSLFRSAADVLKTDDQLHVSGSAPNSANGATLQIDGTLDSTTNNQLGGRFIPTVAPASASTRAYTGVQGMPMVVNNPNVSGAALFGLYGSVYADVGVGNTLGEAFGLGVGNFVPSGTVTNNYGMKVYNPSIAGGGVINQNYGIDIESLTAGSTDIGIRIGKADTYTLQLSDTGGTAAGGITFGTDTNLYRSAADTLKTDDKLTVGNATAISTEGKLTVYSSDTNTATLTNTATSSSTAGAALRLYSDDGAALASGDRLGALAFGGSQNTSHTVFNSAAIQGFATEAWSTSASGTELRFLTTPNTTVTPLVRVTVANNRDGFTFGAAQDTNLYRSAAAVLATDGALSSGGLMAANLGTANGAFLGATASGVVGPGVAFGSTADVNLYRGAGDQLKTDDDLVVNRTSATAFVIQSTTPTSIFTADTSTNKITLGTGTGSTGATMLVLGIKTDAGDPGTCTNGAMYYNSNGADRFRACQDGSWVNVISAVSVNCYVPSGVTFGSCTAGASSTWNAPAGITAVQVIAVGGGGGGGGGLSGAGVNRTGGAGGGGGSYASGFYTAADVGASITVTPGIRGTSGAAGAAGGAGGTSTFDAFLSAFGGGGGAAGVGAVNSGAGGGGTASAGTTAGAGGNPLGAAVNTNAAAGSGAGGASGSPAGNAEYGGGGGGGSNTVNSQAGGSSLHGAGGGGGGAGCNSLNAAGTSSAGGKSSAYTVGGGGAAGGTAGANGNSTTAGSGGGGGNTSCAAGTGVAGGAGGVVGGGGGGGGAGATGGAGGLGGAGVVWVISW